MAHLFCCFVGGEVSLQSLLSGLGGVGSKSLLALKKRLSTVEERNEPIEPPLNKIEADRVRKNNVGWGGGGYPSCHTYLYGTPTFMVNTSCHTHLHAIPTFMPRQTGELPIRRHARKSASGLPSSRRTVR